MGTTTERRYEILDRQFFDDGFVQQHILHATSRKGGSIALRVCIVIKVGANGLITKSHDVEDFACAIRALVTDPALRERMGKSARASVIDLSWPSAFGRFWAATEV